MTPIKPADAVALLPCPFCGGASASVCERDNLHFVMCNNCTAEGPAIEGVGSVQHARAEWNRRATSIAPPASQGAASGLKGYGPLTCYKCAGAELASTEQAPISPRQAAERDALLYGMGMYRSNPDGTSEYIDVQNVSIITMPSAPLVAPTTDAVAQLKSDPDALARQIEEAKGGKP